MPVAASGFEQVTPSIVVTISSISVGPAELAAPASSATTSTARVVPGPELRVPPLVFRYVLPFSDDLKVMSPASISGK